ncbi:MAG: short-chain dehydrogenase [Flammeovirgaceae bacterium]|nr:short-chain dehydrogenase [Flammeovirgaceae bacterium]|tara:strand:+ start:2476 stop:3219 length:744 start_codon:yes stop_codon:yes gene_type:complete
MKKVDVEGKVALVSGSNKGIGRAIVVELIKNGAAKVYAGARNTRNLESLVSEFGDQVIPLELDVTNDAQIKEAVLKAPDVNILVNNAGTLNFGNFSNGQMMEALKENLEINVYGTLRMCSAFIPTLKTHDSAAILNVLSIVGLTNVPMTNAYSVSKAAAHCMTLGLRGELKNTNIFVAGIYPGPIDTDMGNKVESFEKDTPENVARGVLSSIKEGMEDIFPDDMAKQFGEIYASSPKQAERMFADYV